jgi:hypothetical protein
VQGVETAGNAALASHADANTVRLAVGVVEEAGNQPARLQRHQYLAGRGLGPQARGEMWCLARENVLDGAGGGCLVADHDQAGGDADPQRRPVAGARGRQRGDRLDGRQASANGPLGIVFMRLGIAEIRQGAVGQWVPEKAAELLDRGFHDGLAVCDHLLEILRIDPC